MSNYYGISFPFMDSSKGDYIRMNETAKQEIRSNLIHLILTRRGSRYFLPEFGTRLYEFIFEQMDNEVFSNIEDEIREACKKFIPNLEIQSITIKSGEEIENNSQNSLVNSGEELDNRIFRVSGSSQIPYTAQVRLDYSIKSSAVFNSRDFVIINL